MTGKARDLAMWTALRKLNTLRNDLAHQLEPSGVKDRIAHISSVVGTTHPMWEGPTPWPDSMTEFDAAMWVLFARVSSLVEGPKAEIISMLDAQETDGDRPLDLSD